jgi:prepilin-type N-terminal cleavage/methylation domain-containing protein
MASKYAFTLIELLIVVAIIAILAAIAVPNLLEAQVRAKVSKVKNDMRTVNVGIQSYEVDHNQVPLVQEINSQTNWIPSFLMITGANPGGPYPGKCLTTPIAYVASIPMDVFNSSALHNTQWTQFGKNNAVSFVVSWIPFRLKSYKFRTEWARNPRRNGMKFIDWTKTEEFHALMESTGPDLLWWDFQPNTSQQDLNPFFYDPTNGTVSRGQIVYLDSVGPIAPR